ncbi:MAG: UbiA family prenyltransferase [Melioribacteraceae bacterium]|nr:UbiA family prenyltransferase [Melioribacteraceae bacterium]
MHSFSLKQNYPFLSNNFLKAYIITMRPYLLFVSGITGITGLSFITDFSSPNIALIFVVSFFSYGFGQALTDCFQIDTDTISSPYRPLTQGLVSKTQFLLVSIAGLFFCVAVFAIYNIYNLILGVACGAGLYTYTYFKKKWWAGPFYNAWIVTLLFFIAYLTGNSFLDQLPAQIFFAAIAVFFGYANFVISGYFKDIEADRATGYNTFPVVFGRKKAAYLSDLFALFFLISSISAIYYSIQLNSYSLFVIVYFIIGMFQLFFSQTKLHKVNKDELAYPAIELVVHGYITILSSIALAQKPDWALSLIIYYVSFIAVMKLRPIKNQI